MRTGTASSVSPRYRGLEFFDARSGGPRRAAAGIAAALLAMLVTVSAAAAGWREVATPADLQRFARIDEARAKALDQVGKDVSAGDLALIDSVIHAPVVAASPASLAGAWRCRTIKLGGMASHVIYGWFRCRIAQAGGVLTLEKLTGSQRISGTLYPEGDAYVYLGASSVKGEPTPRYSGAGAAAGAAQTPDDQIGLFTALADGRARLELPYPVQESVFDVLELKR